jgi:thiosulfate sulfurtransferase
LSFLHKGSAELSPDAAQALMKSEDVYVIDIRDDNSFSTAHISDAVQLDQTSIGPFLESTEKDTALVIYCYHGISSHSAASFFVEQGFSRVNHIVGGFEAWQQHGLPVDTS